MMQRRTFLAGSAALLLLPARAQAQATTELLGFAPANADSIFYSDLATLRALLTAQGDTPAATSALSRLGQLRDQVPLPLDALENAQLQALCTFHVRGTDHQLLVLVLAAAPGKFLHQVLRQQGALLTTRRARTYVCWSRTPGLVQEATFVAASRLSPGLQESAQALLGKKFWSGVEFDDEARRRLEAGTGAAVEHPELRRLQRLHFEGAIVGNNALQIKLTGVYETPAEAQALGPRLSQWLPFKDRSQPGVVTERSVAFDASGVSYNQLNQFLSRF